MIDVHFVNVLHKDMIEQFEKGKLLGEFPIIRNYTPDYCRLCKLENGVLVEFDGIADSFEDLILVVIDYTISRSPNMAYTAKYQKYNKIKYFIPEELGFFFCTLCFDINEKVEIYGSGDFIKRLTVSD